MRKRFIILIEMEILKTTVGHHLKQHFIENVAFTIASFLEEDEEEKKGRPTPESLSGNPPTPTGKWAYSSRGRDVVAPFPC